MGGHAYTHSGNRASRRVNEGNVPELLFDVAALLITSALGPVAEASNVPASSSISVAFNAGDGLPPITTNGNGVLTDPTGISHGIPVSTFEISHSSPAEIRTLSGISLIRQLGGLSGAQIRRLVDSDSGVVSRLLASPPSAQDVKSLWDSMTPATRAKLATSAPRVVGSLDGFPVSIRNTANRTWIGASIHALAKALHHVNGRALAESDQHELQMLTVVQSALKHSKDAPSRSLVSVDPNGEGKAVVVLGNLQTASYVTYLVPGMFYTVDGQLHAWTADAADLYSQQVSWLHRLSKTHPADAHKTVAVVAWMGYQTPDLTNIGSLSLAYQAEEALASSIESLQLQRAHNLPYTTIIAHSYGSTAALMALTQYDFKVDALAVVGSPGSAAQSVKDLHVRGGNVWVGAAAWDPVPASAFFGSDPAAPSYGAHTMGVGGGTDVVTGAPLGQSVGHNEYFDPKTESIRNMALIGIDHPELVMRGDAADSTRTLALAN
jgi:Alpha/beta hydrolase